MLPTHALADPRFDVTRSLPTLLDGTPTMCVLDRCRTNEVFEAVDAIAWMLERMTTGERLSVKVAGVEVGEQLGATLLRRAATVYNLQRTELEAA